MPRQRALLMMMPVGATALEIGLTLALLLVVCTCGYVYRLGLA
jgi:hypothetical protein